MTAIVRKALTVSVQDYLDGEIRSETKHEYFGGQVYAMTGASAGHNIISGNLYSALRHHLRGGPCQVFMSDVKLRLRVAEQEVFYYPDGFVACRDDDRETYYRRFPTSVIEVVSETTERTDRREKFLAYQTIESLQEYVLVDQSRREVTVFRRDSGWRAEYLSGDGTLTLSSIQFTLPVAEIYEGMIAGGSL